MATFSCAYLALSLAITLCVIVLAVRDGGLFPHWAQNLVGISIWVLLGPLLVFGKSVELLAESLNKVGLGLVHYLFKKGLLK